MLAGRRGLERDGCYSSADVERAVRESGGKTCQYLRHQKCGALPRDIAVLVATGPAANVFCGCRSSLKQLQLQRDVFTSQLLHANRGI
jgi:hypothetical protein